MAAPVGFYAVGAFYVAIGLVLILFAPDSGMPKTLRALEAMTCVREIVTALLGTVERALAILEWETKQGPAFLHARAVALATETLVAFAALAARVRTDPREARNWPKGPNQNTYIWLNLR